MNLGLFTAASGMRVQMDKMDVIANNLSNVNTTSYKKDEVISKSFPERLIARFHDDVQKFPLGSYDHSPIIGKLGTGVELNDIITRFEFRDGDANIPWEKTENPLDVALHGEGFFVIDSPEGRVYTRAGAFFRSEEGILVNSEGYPVLGKKGPIQLGESDVRIEEDGRIMLKPIGKNNWEYADTFELVDFYDKRDLTKIGKNNYKLEEETGEEIVPKKLVLKQGFLENSNVNPIIEMVNMIEVQRLYEALQKDIQTIDNQLEKAVNEISRIG